MSSNEIQFKTLIQQLETNQYKKSVLTINASQLFRSEDDEGNVFELDTSEIDIDKRNVISSFDNHVKFASPSRLCPKGNNISIFTPESFLFDSPNIPNDIYYENLIKLIKALKKNNTVIHLDMSNCEMDERGGLLIADLLSNNQTLKYLDLSGNKIGKTALAAIFDALSNRNKTLMELSLRENNFTGDDIELLSKVAFETISLQALDISANSISQIVVNGLSQMLKRKDCPLLALSLIQVSSGNSSKKLDFCGFFESLTQNTTLKFLEFQQNPLSCQELAKVSQMLAVNKSLETLSLMDTNITHASAEILGKGLAANTSLCCLYLSYNYEMGGEVKEEGDKVKVNYTQQEISNSAAACLVRGIIKHPTLQICDLSRCNLQYKAPFLDLIEQNKQLQELNLYENGFSSFDPDFLKAIKNNSTLCWLNLSSRAEDNLSHSAPMSIEQAMRHDSVKDKIGDKLMHNHKIYHIFAFLSGMHPRLGKDSPIHNALLQNPIYEPKCRQLIFQFLPHCSDYILKDELDTPASSSNHHNNNGSESGVCLP